VRDSAAGFDLDQTLNGYGLGLTSMKERLKLVNGRFSIDSRLSQEIEAGIRSITQLN
jgi:signal transduction histidine kinase